MRGDVKRTDNGGYFSTDSQTGWAVLGIVLPRCAFKGGGWQGPALNPKHTLKPKP